MLISDFSFELPEELIAQQPLSERDASRMLFVSRESECWRDTLFAEFPDLVRAGDVVVINDTRVFPARLIGRRETTGGRVELFLIRELEDGSWETLAKPARRLERGQRVLFGDDGRLQAEVLEAAPDGHRIVRFTCAGSFAETLDELGQTPLPPYIKRAAAGLDDGDRERYQTVYARRRGAIAAPTAGLHFTPRVLEVLKARGVTVANITLHVGYGTFEPVRVSDLGQHKVAPERYELSAETAHRLNAAREAGGRIIAIGTTTTRALESSIDDAGRFKASAGQASLTIIPGYRFRAIDGLLTNFHLPRSSLLVLVSAFAGRDLVLAAYRHAVEARYRFYSYGDCMLII